MWTDEEEQRCGDWFVFGAANFLEIQTNADAGNNDFRDTGGAENTTPVRARVTEVSPEHYDDSTEPKRFRPVAEIYEETEEMQMDEELMLIGTEEPTNYEQAVKDRNWRDAMQKEMNSIEDNGTWILTELPAGHKVIGLKWIYKLKKDVSGNIVKHKTRLVVKGYT